jgi:hypothetical protein
MPLDKSALLDFLEILNDELKREITLVAAGGTAMTLLDLKSSTIDVDLTIPSSDLPEFERALNNVPHGFKIHMWPDGRIFCQNLPDDYIVTSVEIAHFSHTLLKALHPVDIIVTKIGRLDARDIQDIGACIRSCHITKAQIEARAARVSPTYVPNEKDYLYHLQLVLERFF